MGFAGVDDLDGTDIGSNAIQPVDVVEQQVRAFVCRHSTREADGEVVFVELHSICRIDIAQESALGVKVRVLDLLEGRAGDVAKALIVFAPTGDVPVEQLSKRRRGPGRRVDTVCDRFYVVAVEHPTRYLTVTAGDAVDVAAVPERELGHVELVIVHRVQLAEALPCVRTEDAFHDVRGEAIVARRKRCVRGEDAMISDRRRCRRPMDRPVRPRAPDWT